jgi:hypothetical protein
MPRFRIATAATVATVLSMGLVAGCRQTSNAAPQEQPSSSAAPTALGVGAYYQGDRIVAVTTVHFGQNATLTWTPTTTDEHVLAGCSSADIPEDQRLSWFETVRFDGKIIGSSTNCDDRGTDDIMTDMNVLDVGTKNIGRPTSITARIETDPDASPSASPGTGPPATGLMYLAVAEAVPFDQYPLPADPHILPELDRSAKIGLGPTLSEAMFLGPGNPTSLTVPAGNYSLYVNSQTPGFVHVDVDGKALFTTEFWDYRQMLAHYVDWPLGTGGRTVTITVSAEHMTGDWFVAVISVPATATS